MLSEVGVEVAESIEASGDRNGDDVLDTGRRCVDCLCRLALSFFGVDAVARDEGTFKLQIPRAAPSDKSLDVDGPRIRGLCVRV